MCVCVSGSHPCILSHCYCKWQSYIKITFLYLLSFFLSRLLNVKAGEVELHDPAACCECEQEQARVALTAFIRRKKTQLQFQTLEARLNMLLGHQVSGFHAQLTASVSCHSESDLLVALVN